MGVQQDLRDLGIDLRPTHREFADLQGHRAIEILRNLVMLLENDERLLVGELGTLERTGRAGKRIVARAIHRQRTYLKNTHQLLKVLESAEARRARAD